MKKKDFDQLKEKTQAELVEILKKLKAESLNFKMDIKRGKIKNTRCYFTKRKEIARVMTLVSGKKFVPKEVIQS